MKYQGTYVRGNVFGGPLNYEPCGQGVVGVL